MKELNNNIDQYDLIDIYRTHHLKLQNSHSFQVNKKYLPRKAVFLERRTSNLKRFKTALDS